MNRNNNRRRGRGNNRGGGGGTLSNRIDTRARGNAPQMLEKYKKLAHEASLNDDRVQTEYFLQFADHYFRVIADIKAQKDEQRPRRDLERDQGDDSDDGDNEGERANNRRPDARRGNGAGSQRDRSGQASEADDDENPFARSDRKPSPKKPRQPRRPRNEADDDGDDKGPGIDADMLPPSIARAASDDDDSGDGESASEEAAEKPRRARKPRSTTARKPRPRRDDGNDEDELEAVG